MKKGYKVCLTLSVTMLRSYAIFCEKRNKHRRKKLYDLINQKFPAFFKMFPYICMPLEQEKVKEKRMR